MSLRHHYWPTRSLQDDTGDSQQSTHKDSWPNLCNLISTNSLPCPLLSRNIKFLGIPQTPHSSPLLTLPMLFLWPLWKLILSDMKNPGILGLPWERCYSHSEWNLHWVACPPSRTGTRTLTLWRPECGSGTEMPFWVILYYFVPPYLAIGTHGFLPSVSPDSHSSPIFLCFVFCYQWLSTLSLPSDSWFLLPCGSCLLPPFLCMPFCFCSLLPNTHYLFPSN